MCLGTFLVGSDLANKSKGPLAVVDGLLGAEEDLGNFIKNGPSTGIAGHARDQYRKRCDQFANLPPWAKLIADNGGGPLGRICKPYWDTTGATGPTKQPPFIGGQCPSPVRYSVTFQFNAILTDGNNREPPTIETSNPGGTGHLGPITSIEGRGTPSFQSIWLKHGNGLETRLKIGSCAQGCYRNIKINSVTRIGGAADNCGNPPSDLVKGPTPPPDPGPTPAPDPTSDPNNPGGPPILPIPDYEDPIGGPTPIEGPDPYAPTLPTSPPLVPPDSQPGGPENVGDPIGGNPPAGGGGSGTDFGAPPPGRAWIGCFLLFTIPDAYGAIAGTTGSAKVTPRVFGNASLVFAGGLGTAHRVNSGSMSLFREHGALQVTGVYVNSLPGITYTVRPVSVELPPENV